LVLDVHFLHVLEKAFSQGLKVRRTVGTLNLLWAKAVFELFVVGYLRQEGDHPPQRRDLALAA